MDLFVIYGELYKRVRGAVNGVVFGNHSELEVLAETIQACRA